MSPFAREKAKGRQVTADEEAEVAALQCAVMILASLGSSEPFWYDV